MKESKSVVPDNEKETDDLSGNHSEDSQSLEDLEYENEDEDDGRREKRCTRVFEKTKRTLWIKIIIYVQTHLCARLVQRTARLAKIFLQVWKHQAILKEIVEFHIHLTESIRSLVQENAHTLRNRDTDSLKNRA